jgi:SRSO17 transposase
MPPITSGICCAPEVTQRPISLRKCTQIRNGSNGLFGKAPGTTQTKTELRERTPEAVQGDDAALIVDGMGIPKAGTDSVGVSRQWCGATGKIDNCQVTVNCTLARPGKRHNTDQVTWPLGMRLYLSKKWADAADADYDSQQERERYAQRRNDATLPDEIEYQSKRDLAVASLAQIAATDLDYGCIVGDSLLCFAAC